MGQVWLAQNTATGAEVAVKILLPLRVGAGDALVRFRREAHATAALSHRAIVRAFDLVELDPSKGSLLLVMERLRGHTLADRLDHVGRLPVAEVLEVALPILSALEHAHAAGVIHRDLKPENVFLATEPDGRVMPKLVDFGISKLRNATTAITNQGALVGTPCYMAPEQARGEPVDARTDVFAMGIVLYECLSGRAAFSGTSVHDVVRAVIEDEPAPLTEAPPALAAVIARAMAKSADDRYARASELAAALCEACPGARAALGAVSVPPGPVSLSSVPPAGFQTTLAAPAPPRRSRAVAWTAGAVAAIAMVGGLRYGMSHAGAASAASGPARERAPHGKTLVDRAESTARGITTGTDARPSEPLPSSTNARRAPSSVAGRPSRSAPPPDDVAASAPEPAPPPVEEPKPQTIVRDPDF